MNARQQYRGQAARAHFIAFVAALLLLSLTGHTLAVEIDTVSRAQLAIEAGNHSTAVAMLEQRMAMESEDTNARFLLARVLSWVERWPDSLEQYNVLLANEPDNVDYLYGKSQVLVWSGRAEDALPLLERARELAPEYESVWRLESHALQAAGGVAHRERLALLTEEARGRFPDSTEPFWETSEPPHAAPVPRETGVSEIETGFSFESLDNGQSDWRSLYIEASRRLDARTSVYGLARGVERFNQTDIELLGGGYLPVTKKWTTVLEGSIAPDADVLPRWAVLGEMQRPLQSGFGVHVGLRHSRYENDYTNRVLVTGDRYWGNNYAGYTLSASRLQGAGTNLNHQVRLDRFYGDGDRNRIGLLTTYGDETESVGNGRFVTNNTLTLIVRGRHWFQSQWAISWELIWHDQGDAYRRGGLRAGLRRQF